MSQEQFSNNAQTTLSGNGGSISSGATSFKVASATAFPSGSGQCRVLIDSEIIIVQTPASSNTFTVLVRGAEGTTAAAHNDGATVTQVLTAGALANLPVKGNLAINGGFDWWQPNGPSYSVAPGGGSPSRLYIADQIAFLGQSGSTTWAFSRQSGGPNSVNYLQATLSGSNDKICFLQPIESLVAQALSNAGQQMTLAIRFKLSTGTFNFNLAILEWTGTVDQLPSPYASSWSSGNGSDPAWNGSFTVLGKTSLAASSSWQQLSATANITSNVNNLVLALWSDNPISTSATLSVAELQLVPGSAASVWMPEDPAVGLHRCQRFYEKSYDPDTAPGAVANGMPYFLVFGSGTNIGASVPYKSTKRIGSITIALYDEVGNAGKVTILNVGNNQSGTVRTSSSYGFAVFNNTTAGSGGISFNWTSDARL